MIIHLISEERKSQLMDIARLLLVFENPVLWDGKNEDELTGETDFGKISLSITEAQANILQNLAKECDEDCTEDDEMDTYLISKIKLLRLTQQNSPTDRLAVAKEIIDELANKCRIRKKAWLFPTASRNIPDDHISELSSSKGKIEQSRIVLFELIIFCIASEGISESRKQLLEYFAESQGIDTDYFNDLLAQALAVQKEFTKTINIIME